MLLAPAEKTMWEKNVPTKDNSKMTDEQINQKYDEGQQRILTEINRDFVESLCQALNELFAYKTIMIKEKASQAVKVGKIKRWYSEKKVAEVKFSHVNFINISIGDNFFLVDENKSWCQPATIQSIHMNNQFHKAVQITTERQISIKFDVDARKELELYWVS